MTDAERLATAKATVLAKRNFAGALAEFVPSPPRRSGWSIYLPGTEKEFLGWGSTEAAAWEDAAHNLEGIS